MTVATDRDRAVLAFLRGGAATERVLVAINFTSRTQRVHLDVHALPAAFAGRLDDLLGGRPVAALPVLELAAHQAVVLRPAPRAAEPSVGVRIRALTSLR